MADALGMDGGEPLDLVDLDRAAVDRAIVGEVAECALGNIAKLVRLGLRLQRHQRRHPRAAYSEAEVAERRQGGARRLVVIDCNPPGREGWREKRCQSGIN